MLYWNIIGKRNKFHITKCIVNWRMDSVWKIYSFRRTHSHPHNYQFEFQLTINYLNLISYLVTLITSLNLNNFQIQTKMCTDFTLCYHMCRSSIIHIN